MPVWQIAMDLAVRVFELTQSLPKKEDYALTSQIRRSSTSIHANIAEAFGRYHRANKLNFYYNARGSLCETKSHLQYMQEVGYIDKEQRKQIDDKLDYVTSLNDLQKEILSLLSIPLYLYSKEAIIQHVYESGIRMKGG